MRPRLIKENQRKTLELTLIPLSELILFNGLCRPLGHFFLFSRPADKMSSLNGINGARQPDVRRPGFALDKSPRSSFDDHSIAFVFSEAIVAKRLGEQSGHSVKFRLFRDPETAGSPEGGSLGAAG
jgi:hypothetical protein